MSSETTSSSRVLDVGQIGEQAAAVEALLGLIHTHRTLPKPYVVIHNIGRPRLSLQLRSPSEFETWRSALGIHFENITLHTGSGSAWLKTDGMFAGVPYELSAHGVHLHSDASPQASGPTAEPQITGRLAQLLDAIRTHRGEWTTEKTRQMYRALGVTAPQRGTVRRDLAALHRLGHLVQHEQSGRRYYTLRTRTGGDA